GGRAGPAMNLIPSLLLALPVHPKLGWFDTSLTIDQYKPWMIFTAAMAQLQIIAVMINLIPVPPLDGFGIISSYMDEPTRERFTTPPVSTVAFIFLFVVIWQVPGVER